MFRPILVLALTLAIVPAGFAQDAAAPAAAPQLKVDPAAGMQQTRDPQPFLTGIYATRAVIEICAVTVDQTVATAMLADQVRYEHQLGYDPGTASEAYAGVKKSVESTKPDCTDGSADRQGVDAVLAAYKK